MRKDRFLKILVSIIIVSILVYLRFYSSLFSTYSNQRIIDTVLSLMIVLISFRTLIEIVIVGYNLDNKSKGIQVKDNLIVGLTNLFNIVSVVSVFLGILAILGLDLKQVFTTLSIVAAAIAIVTKDFIVEIIIGIINGFSSKIELEDYVEYNNQKGKIVDIGLQKITLLNEDDDIVYIPNTNFYSAEVINYTKRDIRRMGVDFQLYSKHLDTVEALERKLANACMGMSEHLVPNSFHLKITHISREAIDFKFQYTMLEVKREVHRQMRRIVMRTITNLVNEKKHT